MNFIAFKFQSRNFLDDAKMDLNQVRAATKQMKALATILVLIMTMALVGMTCDVADAAIYCVDEKNGSDSASGSVSSPWRSIAKANRSVSAGDTVLIKKGTYSDVINPNKSGTASKPITYANHKSHDVLIKGPGNDNPVNLNRDYIVIEGLKIKMSNPPSNGSQIGNILIRGDHNTIRDCEVINPKDRFSERSRGTREMGVVISGGSHNTIENCTIKYMSFNGIKLNSANHTTIRNNEIVDNYSNSISITTSNSKFSGILIENNRLEGSSVSDGIQFNGNFDSGKYATDQSNQGAIIRGNVIYNHAENGIDLKGTKHILIENNIIHGAIADNDGFQDGEYSHGGLGGITVGTGSTSTDVIIRGNLIYDNYAAVRVNDGWKIYNNTILGNNRDNTGSNSSYKANGGPLFVGVVGKYLVKNAAIKNNIIAGHNHAEICLNADSVQLDIDNNLYGNDKKATFVNYSNKGNWSKLGFDQWRGILKKKSRISGADQNSHLGSPDFESNLSLKPTGKIERDLIKLSSSSNAVDKGGYLTTTSNSGSGNIIYVKDAGYFCDGFDATKGDMIKIGNNPPTEVMSVDYKKNVIVVDDKISWDKGDGVALNYEGNAPDIGAAEYINTTIPSPSLRIVVTSNE